MDKFTKDAFNQAEEQQADREATAFANVPKSYRFSVELTAFTIAGVEKSAQLIQLAKDNGLEDTLHKYADGLFAGGFKAGYEEGRKSMIED